jgi:crossover junction endodeoxyribonuclease RusA
MEREIVFVVYASPAPQGSMKAFVIRGKARLTCDNKKTVPYRHCVTQAARRDLANRNICEPMAGKHAPVVLDLEFHLARPESAPKKRRVPSVKPDIDKLCRATLDALTGVLFVDDGQVVDLSARKVYAQGPEMVVIRARG